MTTLDIIYYLIIVINFVVSIIFVRLWKQFYFVYFFVIIVAEFLILLFPNAQKIYNILDIFTIIFLGFIFQKEIKNKIWLAIISFSAILLSIYFFSISKTLYSIYTGVICCLYMIIISLTWFCEKVINEEKNGSLLKEQLFWISSSLLFWAVFYLFRMTPMYWIQSEDKNFLIVLKYIFQVATNLSYILFLIGLLSKRL
ncbi:hypothetical protein SAMN05421594_3038 [Chryseobacterium oleae]|uniref:YhhN-like protein n=1 Tax=Chryseobacterium oleae TaxID=491207 RepID=A0A1I4ZJR9_CHROL|nr:hypothetical protein SAMN05421594_3038 [Chryseobacterium oleae]